MLLKRTLFLFCLSASVVYWYVFLFCPFSLTCITVVLAFFYVIGDWMVAYLLTSLHLRFRAVAPVFRLSHLYDRFACFHNSSVWLILKIILGVNFKVKLQNKMKNLLISKNVCRGGSNMFNFQRQFLRYWWFFCHIFLRGMPQYSISVTCLKGCFN